MGKKKKKPKAAGASASADNDEAGVEVDWKEVADRVDRALDETLALPGALANLPTALPDVKLANCDLAAEGYVNVSFTGPKQYNALIESGIVYRVCGPCAEAEVHTSHDHNLLIRPRHYTTEGGVPEPIAVFYAGIFKATGLLIVGYVGGGVQSTVVAQYLAQKALVQLTQPEVYRSPTELGMGSLSIAMGTAFDEATLQQLGMLTTTQLQARFPLEQDRTYMNVDPGDRRAPLSGDAKLRCMTDHDFAIHYQMLPGLVFKLSGLTTSALNGQRCTVAAVPNGAPPKPERVAVLIGEEVEPRAVHVKNLGEPINSNEIGERPSADLPLPDFCGYCSY